MNNLIKISVLITTFFLGFMDVSAATVEQETQHLLNYMANSGCTFIRNGTEYSSEEARSHIQRKYNYVKNKVNSTEQVIEYAATESSFSGKEYSINCPGKPTIPSAEWLTKELLIYRASVLVEK